MLRKFLKITGIIFGILVVGILAFYLIIRHNVGKRIDKQYAVTVQSIELKTDSAALALGARLVVSKGCTECHGEDLGGKIFIQDPMMGNLIAANLTKGKGGLPQDYNVNDWVLALKHGLNREQKSLLFMPAQEFTWLSESDMAAIISYCQQVPNVDREFKPNSLGPMANILTYFDQLPLFPAELVPHDRTLTKHIEPEISIAYGHYIATACEGCHRKNMQGGGPVAPGFPPVPNVSSTSRVASWSTEEFTKTLRTGETPDGRILDPKDMPWTMSKAFTDVEIQALHLYLKSI
jgi:cytochrome c553